MKRLLNFFLIVGLCAILISCNSSSKKPNISFADKSGTITITNYAVKVGNATTESIETGLKLIAKELKVVASQHKNLKGTMSYSFRCEPDGLIRWMSAGKTNLNVENEHELKNEMTGHLMKKQVRFPELGEITMIEAEIKFE